MQEKPAQPVDDVARAERLLGRVYIGTAGWNYPDWNGIVYPSGVPSGFDPLAYMIGYVRTIEINSTFYRLPAPRAVEGWARRAEARRDFRFAMKVWQGFTHGAPERDAGRTSGGRAPFPVGPPEAGPLAAQREAARILADAGRLGALLVQYPYGYHFTRDHFDGALRLLDALDGFPRAVEFRHRSWIGDELLEALTERGVAIANIDQPILGENIPPLDLATAALRYIRMHGRNAREWFSPQASVESRYSYLYSEEELAPWIEKTLELAAGGPTFLIFNNHGQGQALCNAIQAMHLVDEAGRRPREDDDVGAKRGAESPEKPTPKPFAPDSLAARYPVLRDYARVRPALGEQQLNLF